MATGGTGDILTGVIAGMLAQHPHCPFEAVLAAVYLHGLAGDMSNATWIQTGFEGGHPLVATDLITALPRTFQRVRWRAKSGWALVAGELLGRAQAFGG